MPLDGQRLKEARERKQISQRKLSAELGFGENTLFRIEHNHDDPGFSKVVAIADRLDVSLDFLARRTNDSKSHKSKVTALTSDEVQELTSAIEHGNFTAAFNIVNEQLRKHLLNKGLISTDGETTDE